MTTAPESASPFIETLQDAQFLDPSLDTVVARAPGRLDVMGGIADYSGSLVLQLPLALAAFAAAQRQEQPAITIRSLQAGQTGDARDVTIPLGAIAPGGSAVHYPVAARLFGEASADEAPVPWPRWSAYVAGCLIVLGRERSVPVDRGVRLLIDSRVPLGKGVSSSAAIEVAAMRAIAALYGVPLDGEELAILCQRVENRVVGAPCGLMDQMTASLGEQDRLLALLCQPARVQAPVVIPEAFDVWGIDSGVRHAVTGSDYTSVRVGASMGYRIIAHVAGLVARPREVAGRVAIDDPHWSGYLANVGGAAWRDRFRDAVPEKMSGRDFLEHFGGTTDAVARVDPARTYPVRAATAHPIHEHERVTRFREVLSAASRSVPQAGGASSRTPATDLAGSARPSLTAETMSTGTRLGELMNASHASYGACGLGSAATDLLFELVAEAGPNRGLFGARITGGGSGGTVAVLGLRGCDDVIGEIASRFRRETGAGGTIMHGSSDGAMRFGIVRLPQPG